jgi:hypothetical protein
LVSLLKNRPDDAIRQFELLPSYQRTQVLYDPDLGNLDVRDIISFAQLPPRQIGYGFSGELQFELDLLFREKVELGPDQLRKALEGFDEEVKIEKADLMGLMSESWIVNTNKYQILLFQRPLKKPDVSGRWENEDLRDAIASAKFQLSIKAKVNEPIKNEVSYYDSIELIRSLVNPDLVALGDGSQWLDAKDINRYFELAKANKSVNSKPFSIGEFNGQFYYLSDETDGSRDNEFFENLNTAIRQFRDSSDPDKRMVVQFQANSFIPEQVSAVVDRIKRTEYRAIELVVTISEDSKFDRLIRKGDRFVAPLFRIDEFELTTSGDVKKQSKRSN